MSDKAETNIVRRLRQHALPDPHDEREVLHAPLLSAAADEIEKLCSDLTAANEQLKAAQQRHEALNAEVERYRKALGRIAVNRDAFGVFDSPDIAREALASNQKEKKV